MDPRIGGVERLLVLLVDTALPHHATEADLYVLAGTAEPVIEVEVAERGVEIVARHQADRPFAEPDAFSPCSGAGCGATCLGNFDATPRSVLARLSLAGFAGFVILGVQRDGRERRRKAEDRKAEQTYTGHVRTRLFAVDFRPGRHSARRISPLFDAGRRNLAGTPFPTPAPGGWVLLFGLTLPAFYLPGRVPACGRLCTCWRKPSPPTGRRWRNGPAHACLNWAMGTGNQGMTLTVLAERRGDLRIAERALAQITAAFETCRNAHHGPNAAYYEAQLPAARALVERLRKG
jgi:hypothetical protein